MERQRRKRPSFGRLLRIFLAVAAVFAAAWFGVELLGRQPAAPAETQTVQLDAGVAGLFPGLAVNRYDLNAFVWEGSFLTYTGPETARRGIDVSAHQQGIDWAAVASEGVEFAMLRVGYRGYTEGATFLDERFYENVGGALENGIQVGVYFFSQAISVEEAREEADIVLRAIEGLDITYPVVYDWENVHQPDARTANLDDETLTACAAAFCETVEAAGYTAAVYFNQVYGYNHFDLLALEDYVFWLAQYADVPDFYYAFDMWQYTSSGQVAGIDGDVDLNLSFWSPEDP